jgi:hypothetical protein
MAAWVEFLGLVHSLQFLLLFEQARGYIFCSVDSFQFEELVYNS